jgi:hypothetical protein
MMQSQSRGSALVEFTLLAPILMLLFLGLVAVAQEAAHTAATAPDGATAIDRGTTRGYQVGSGYRLGNGSLQVAVDASQFGPGGRVSAVATYHLGRTEVPLLGSFDLPLQQQHVEVVSRYRSFPLSQGRAP